MLGLFEPVCAPWQVDGIPPDFSFGELPPDWDRMAPYLEKTMSRVPVSEQIGIKKFFCGPESFTPDLQPIVGEAPELRNYFVAAGLNSIGILTGGGIGRTVAAVDHRRHPGRRCHRHQHRSAAPLPGQPASTGPPGPSSRLAWSTHCHYPNRPTQHRARRAAVAVSRPAGSAAGLFPGRERLGRRGLVRAGRGRPGSGRVDLGTPAVVRLLGRRTSRGPDRRDRHGHVVHGEVRCPGPRRGPRARADLS